MGGGGGCSSWPFMVLLHGGRLVWLVVVKEDDEQRQMSSFIIWLPHRTWWVSERRLGGSFCLLTWAGHGLVTVIFTCRRRKIGNPLVLAYLRQNAPSKLKQHLSAIAKPSITTASFQTAESSTHVNTPSSASLTALLDNAHIGALQPNSVEERHNVDEPGAVANAISGVQPDNSQERNSAPQSS